MSSTSPLSGSYNPNKSLSNSLQTSDAKSIKHVSGKGSSKSRLTLSSNHDALKISAVATNALSSSILKCIYAYYYIELKGTDVSININSMAKRLGLSKAKVIKIAQTEGGLQKFIEKSEQRALALSCYGKIAKNYASWFGILSIKKGYSRIWTGLTPDQLIKTIAQGLALVGKEHSQTEQVFSSADLKEIHLIQELKGKGSFGTVYKTINLTQSFSSATIHHTAIKVFDDEGIDQAHARSVLLELNPDGNIEGLPRPPSEVTLLATMEKSFCSLELFSSDLKKKNLTEFHALPIKEKLKLCGQLTNGLKYMHENNWYHGDIKPANCLMKVDPETKKPIKFVLSDFDGAQKNKKPTIMTSTYYPYPSFHHPQPKSKEREYGGQDVFGLSKTIIEILIGEKIEKFDMNLPITKGKLIARLVPEEVINILMSCSKEVNERPTASELNEVFMTINS